MARFGSDHACADYLARKRWPSGFVCPHCGSRKTWHLEARPWILEASGVVLRHPAGNSAIEQKLTRFDAHMRDVWGLADCTRRKRCPVGVFSCRAFRRAADLPGRPALQAIEISASLGLNLRFRFTAGPAQISESSVLPSSIASGVTSMLDGSVERSK